MARVGKGKIAGFAVNSKHVNDQMAKDKTKQKELRRQFLETMKQKKVYA